LRLDSLATPQVRNGCMDVFDEAKPPQIQSGAIVVVIWMVC
jgi:hypothetical protein